jgi:phosphohistidine swiveling domain-containing protein
VRHIGRLRATAKTEAVSVGFTKASSVLGATIDEITSKSFTEAICAERIENLKRYSSTNFPKRLSSQVENASTHRLGVSSGKAKGKLVTREDVGKTEEPVILYTNSLTPDLVEHFGEIAGIVSNHGGLLSHLAILAREARLPVVVGFELSTDVCVGAIIEIDGEDGRVNKASVT